MPRPPKLVRHIWSFATKLRSARFGHVAAGMPRPKNFEVFSFWCSFLRKAATISVGMRPRPSLRESSPLYPHPQLFSVPSTKRRPEPNPAPPPPTARHATKPDGPAGPDEPATARNNPEPAVERITITVEEAAAMLGISRTSGYEYVRTGQLPAIRIGRRLLVPVRAINELLDTDTASGAAPTQRRTPA